ncbi:radical SAM protein [Cellulosilyticum ruminicola]|uniref:radical SAM protein n=1 Tax=Cellulosilyticum ruminicola TaxID=425254 RepID=UPI0006D00D18|nr:radical SAM protein [Cellulosilyticum ruminicola]
MNVIEIVSLNGNKYIYNCKYNIVQSKSQYNEEELDEMAKRYFTQRPQISKDAFMNDNTQEQYLGLCLVMTDQCNFRCSYCINSSEYNFSKGYSNCNISIDTIDKALELYVTNYKKSLEWNPKNRFSITFYGGEPLLQYDKICYTIEKVKKYYKILDAQYTITTNGYLLTEDKVKYLIDNNVYINVSIDGYEEIHDLNRKTIDNKPTFAKVVYNFMNAKAIAPSNMLGILITMDYQVSPIKMYEFFLENRDLDESIIRVNTVSGINTNYHKKYFPYKNYMEEMKTLLHEYLKANTNVKFVDELFRFKLASISNKLQFSDKTCAICSPLKSKLTVSVEGNLHICEKINQNYSIGNVESGIDKEVAYGYYENLCNIRKEKCANCSIKNLCDICYAILNTDGSRFTLDKNFCKNQIEEIKLLLTYYCTTLDL